MKIIVVDDERHALQSLERAIRNAGYHDQVTCFLFAEDALDYAREHSVDVAFLDIELSRINGMQLAGDLRQINPQINIIFVTGHSDYMEHAFLMHASGYVMKPINPERVRDELSNLRYLVADKDEGVYIRCFGNFEIFVDGRPVAFRRPKSKEILAYLVDRKGAGISRKELAAVLWEDEGYSRSVQSHLHILLSELIKTLAAAGAGDIIIKDGSYYAIDISRVKCDYYRYGEGDVENRGDYMGEYMTNYSWAELRKGDFEKE